MIYQPTDYQLGDFILALREVESGGKPDFGEDALGDGGKALGPLQIWRVCWEDAQVPFPYSKCGKFKNSVHVALNYWFRYCGLALMIGDWETMARIWNGGPKGATKESTVSYWERVRSVMLKNREAENKGDLLCSKGLD